MASPSDSPSEITSSNSASPSQDISANNENDTPLACAPAPTDVPLPPKPKPLVPLTPFSDPPPKKKPAVPGAFKAPSARINSTVTTTSTSTTTSATSPVAETSVASGPETNAEESPLVSPEITESNGVKTEEPVVATSDAADVSTAPNSSEAAKSSRKPISNLSKRPSRPKTSSDSTKKSRFRPPPKPGSEYTVPFWSAIPEHPYKLEVLKGGSIRSILDINLKTHYTFGRLATCDMVMEHQSVSRKHAVIQFRDNSTVYLYDLGSTHGSFVNKRRIPPHIYTELKVGDLISFGASTRRYILDGPEALRPQGKRQVPMLLDENNNLTAELPSHFVWEEDAAQGATWGVSTDVETAIQKELEEEQARANRKYEKTDTLSERQKKLLERMELRERKIANIRTEMANLQKKQEQQNGELTDGQKARIAQCEQIIEKLEEQKESLQETIHDSFEDAERRSQKKKTNPLLDEEDDDNMRKKKKKKTKLNDFTDSDEEDEFYDRTQAVQQTKTTTTITTNTIKPPPPTKDKKDPLILARAAFKAAQMELDNVESRSFKLNLQLRDFEADVKRRKDSQDDNDALDAFMAGITDVVKKDKRREIEEELKKLELKKIQCELDLKQKQATLVQAEYTQAGSLEAAKLLKEKHEQERKETKKKEEEALIDKTKKVSTTTTATSVKLENNDTNPQPSSSTDSIAKDSNENPNNIDGHSSSSDEKAARGEAPAITEKNGEGEEATEEDSELARIRARIEAQRKSQREAKKKQAADATAAFIRLGKEKQAERERAKEEKERLEIEREAEAAAAEKKKIMDALEEEEKRKAADPLERMRAAFDRKKASIAPDDEFSLHAKRKLLQTRQLAGEADDGISAGLHVRKKVKDPPTPAALEFAPASVPSSTVVAEPKPIQSTKPKKYSADMIDDEEVRDVTWVPPANQRGDGKTHLNAKYGY